VLDHAWEGIRWLGVRTRRSRPPTSPRPTGERAAEAQTADVSLCVACRGNIAVRSQAPELRGTHTFVGPLACRDAMGGATRVADPVTVLTLTVVVCWPPMYSQAEWPG